MQPRQRLAACRYLSGSPYSPRMTYQTAPIPSASEDGPKKLLESSRDTILHAEALPLSAPPARPRLELRCLVRGRKLNIFLGQLQFKSRDIYISKLWVLHTVLPYLEGQINCNIPWTFCSLRLINRDAKNTIYLCFHSPEPDLA
jgi:hypothetical protein